MTRLSKLRYAAGAFAAAALLASSACQADGADANSNQAAQDQAVQDQAPADDQQAAEEAAASPDDQQGEPGADKDSKPEQYAEDLAAGASGAYGGEFTVEDEPVTLASALKAAAAEPDATYKVSARIEKVCKKKGCWFTLNEEGVDQPVRVKMKDYGFFVPRNSDGAQAVVEGELVERVVPQKEAQHYANDEVEGTGQKPRKIEGDQKKWEMMITAARIEMPAAE